jgi:peptidoglycan/xylan/chitin deacetylase (PgdA/CDA1 family)
MLPEQFEQRMTWLKRSGYPVLPLDEAVRQLDDDSLPDHAVVITIDDGWSSTYTHMLPILEALDLPATVYVTTWYSENQIPVVNVALGYIAKRMGQSASSVAAIAAGIEKLPTICERAQALREWTASLKLTTDEWWAGRQFHLMTPAQVGDASRRGLDIQLHTHRHKSSDIDSNHLEREIADNRAALARACGRAEETFCHFCYPSGVGHSSAVAVLKGIGVRSATLGEGVNPPGTNPHQLNRFFDGRSVSETEFQAYLSGALEMYCKMGDFVGLLRRRRPKH